ncbi:MAG: S8 family serine peptidase [Burkholderiales bacterium]
MSRVPAFLATKRFAAVCQGTALAIALGCTGVAFGEVTSQRTANGSGAWATGYILVQPRPGLSTAELAKALAPHGGQSIGQISALGVHVIALPATAREDVVAAALAKNPNIKFAEPDRLVLPSLVTNDTYYSSEWHLAKTAAPSAWDYASGAGVTVAVLDSGVDATHPDLAAQIVPGWNFYDNNSNTADVYGHGTKVAGVVAATANNATGVAGMAWNAKIMPVRVTDTSGTATLSAFANGLIWAADHGAKVANLSFAVQSSSTVISAAQYFKNKGGVVVNSAGNYGTLDSTPASDALVSVSATDSNDVVASWSSYGPYVDLAAPGANIWTTVAGGGYGAVSGTSFSSPLTAGVAALVLSKNPELTPTQVVDVLKTTAVDLGAVGADNYYGAGRVNAYGAVIKASQVAPADTVAPTVAIGSPANAARVTGVVNVDASASDNVGVARVELYVNNVKVATDTVAPYAFSWDSSALAGTTASLTVKAYDAAGNVANAGISVAVAAGAAVADTTPPVVTVTGPGSGAVVSGVVTVTTAASDNSGASGITQTLYIDGALVATGNGGTLTYKWNTNKAAKGTHTIAVNARDAAGNFSTAQRQVTK